MSDYYKYFIVEKTDKPPFWRWKRCDYQTYRMAEKLDRTKSRKK